MITVVRIKSHPCRSALQMLEDTGWMRHSSDDDFEACVLVGSCHRFRSHGGLDHRHHHRYQFLCRASGNVKNFACLETSRTSSRDDILGCVYFQLLLHICLRTVQAFC